MNEEFRKLLQESFSNMEKIDLGALKQLTEAMGKAYQELRKKFASENPEEREEAVREAQEIKSMIEKQMAALCEKTGLTPIQMQMLAERSALQQPKQREIVDEMIRSFNEPNEPSSPPKKRKRSRLKIKG